MKKKNLKNLNLNKRSISNLRSGRLKGGDITTTTTTTVKLTPEALSLITYCDNDDNDTYIESRGCDTDTCDQTFTCPDWSCAC